MSFEFTVVQRPMSVSAAFEEFRYLSDVERMTLGNLGA